MPDLTKTIKLKLNVNQDQIELLKTMTELYRQVCNSVSAYIFEHDFELSANSLNHELYRDIRRQFGLKSQLTQSVFRTTTARYKTVKKQLLQHPFKYKGEDGKWHHINRTLEWLWRPIKFRRPQADLVRGRDYSFVDNGNMLSINTLEGRIKVTYESKHFSEYLNNKNWQLGTGKIVEYKGFWYIHIPVKGKVKEFTKNNVRHTVGIDRGLRFLAVSYDEQGKTEFVSGRQILRKRSKFLKTRSQLQAKKTKSAMRALKRISGRENRWMADVNHQISKTLVEKYGPNTLFTIEDLSGVSFEESNLSKTAKHNYEIRSWSFYQLEQFLIYKAHENCSKAIKVPAKYTSQRCPRCGAVCKEQRSHDTHEYICKCGYRSNDDRIGAMNIQVLGTRWASGEENPKFSKLTASE
ncbi:RNA-guided endonuclease TnpB family protein [Pectinatus frisingensis]|uniref:RNA-guided endonuclease TnpB family protein n=1 Tax=Pectinatus frisingensis TaxID=865 RepID=UPI0015F74F67|nr:RNA-guided endonuclease TnpB family protein [Pectinatus frisingensis]